MRFYQDVSNVQLVKYWGFWDPENRKKADPLPAQTCVELSVQIANGWSAELLIDSVGGASGELGEGLAAPRFAQAAMLRNDTRK